MNGKALEGNPKHADKVCLFCGGPIRYREHATVWKRVKFCSHRCSCDYRFHRYTPAEKFWRRVLKLESGCWEFQGCRDKWGYAHFGINGKRVQAHRHAYELTNGPIPSGKLIMHTCDNPPCVNPDHLRIGTDLENRADASSKRRLPHGSKMYNAKLNEEKVAEMRQRYAAGGVTQRELGEMYGVSQSTVAYICKGETWTHV